MPSSNSPNSTLDDPSESPIDPLPPPEHSTWPVSLRGPVRLPPSAGLVSNADDDVFVLYTHLQAAPERRGLGYIDNTRDILDLSIELKVPRSFDEVDKAKEAKPGKGRPKEKEKCKEGKTRKDQSPETSPYRTKAKSPTERKEKDLAIDASVGSPNTSPNGKDKPIPSPIDTKPTRRQGFAPIPPPSPDKCLTGKEKRKARKSKDKEKDREQDRFAPVLEDLTIDLKLAQDSTALRSRSGDTGSVVWRASLDFAKMILEQIRFRPFEGLFDLERLKSSHVLELGSGTGLLALLLSPHVQTYTSTDLPELLRLQEKTFALNQPRPANLTLSPLDWTDLAHEYLTPVQRRRIFKPANPLDLIILVDCIYNPALLPALIVTMEHLTTPRQTAVVVVCELRSPEVVTKFLELWLEKPGWSIWRIDDGAGMGAQYAVWLGWRTV